MLLPTPKPNPAPIVVRLPGLSIIPEKTTASFVNREGRFCADRSDGTQTINNSAKTLFIFESNFPAEILRRYGSSYALCVPLECPEVDSPPLRLCRRAFRPRWFQDRRSHLTLRQS